MTYSYTQISNYLTCPRRYRHRYLDGWQEKDTRAAMLFGRAFEQTLAAYFRHEDATATLYREWAVYQKQPLRYSERDSWDRMLQQGVQLLERFCQEDRVRIRQPRRNLQIKFVRPLAAGNDFVAYVDAIGQLDGRGCLLETQYLHTTITDGQRREFSQLVNNTIGQIEAAQFLPHSGIRFPQNPCSSCPYVGLCLDKPKLVEAALIRRPGAEQLGWLDELNY